MLTVTGREIIDSKLVKPFRLIIGGGSGTGKTTLLKRLVNECHFETPFDKIIYCYPHYLDESPCYFDQIIEYRPGLGDLEYFSQLPKNSLVIFDDMMHECGNSNEIMKLFSVIARKKNLSVIFIVQNVFDKGKQIRNIRINATGFILFNFFTANDITHRLIRDIGLKNIVPRRLLDNIYDKSFSYIYVDLHPKRHSRFESVKSNIFDKYFSIFNKMEYIAIPKSEFIKHFKIIEAQDGTVRALKDAIEIREEEKGRKRRRSAKKSRAKRRKRSPTPSSTGSESTASSE